MQAILNPPGNPKAKYYVRKDDGPLPATADEWLPGVEEVAGSWWPHWLEWLQTRSGKQKKAPKAVGNSEYPASDPAPGLYVIEEH